MVDMPKGVRKISYTWNNLEHDRSLLVRKIRSQEKRQGFSFKRIYGLPRGGLPLAVCLSHDLGIDLVLELPKKFDQELIVCDEIADTGRTLRSIKKTGYFIVVIHKHSESITEPDIWLREKPNHTWIAYAWEAQND